jgi:hypothetical protein
MIGPSKRKLSFLDLEALPPDLRDLSLSCHPRSLPLTGGAEQCPPLSGLAPESALRVHPCRALYSAPASTRIEEKLVLQKLVVVADREK